MLIRKRNKMKKIEYLPKWYEKSLLNVKQKEIEIARDELLKTGKLNDKEIEFIKDANIRLCGDTYSRNYIIRQINELIKFVNYR